MSTPVWVGIDDTDSPRGGCTTFALTEVIEAARNSGLDLIGEPRLVRLNPNIPYKTRGNAALAARFGHGQGRRRRQGVGPGGTVWSFARGRGPRPAERLRFLEAAWEAVRRSSRRGEEGTDPTMVAVDHPLPGSLYRDAVARWLDWREVDRLLAEEGAWTRVEGSGQGLVGAASAIAWPGRRRTWELITYRRPDRWGTTRDVDGRSVQMVQSRFPDLFLCHDPRTRRLMVAPHTTCPILFGLRSRKREPLPRALKEVVSEPVERWTIFRTNQGTGDHLVRREAHELRAYDAARLRGMVLAPPLRLPGGHVRWPLTAADGVTIDCIAFEPTKTLPRVAEDLAVGDRLEIWGGRGADPTFRVEGLRLLARAARRGAPRPPRCEACGRRTRSLGQARGYRCRACRVRIPPERAEWSDAVRFPLGTYHPTPSARRHLAPLGPEG